MKMYEDEDQDDGKNRIKMIKMTIILLKMIMTTQKYTNTTKMKNTVLETKMLMKTMRDVEYKKKVKNLKKVVLGN